MSIVLCSIYRRRVRARPSPLTENDHETPEEGSVDDDSVDVLEPPEVERSIDVIPEVTPVSSVGGSPVAGSSERTASEKQSSKPLIKDSLASHATTAV